MNVYLRDIKDGKFTQSDVVQQSSLDFSYPDVSLAKDIHVRVDGNKVAYNYFLKVSFNTAVKTSCDRCLDKVDLEVEDTFNLLITRDPKFSEIIHDDFEDVLMIKVDEFNIDISKQIFDGVILALPLKRMPEVNELDTCLVCNKNFSELFSNPKKPINPELEKLKNFFK